MQFPRPTHPTVPIVSGFWVPWTPLSLPQRWPFCWWVAVVVDHFSRRVMGSTTFARRPTSKAVQLFLDHTLRASKAQPKHLICDKGKQFWCKSFKCWCRRREIKPRYGAVHQHGSIAVVERFINTLKQYLRLLILVPIERTRLWPRTSFDHRLVQRVPTSHLAGWSHAQ